MRVNTIRYFPDARYTDLATNTTLGTATRFDTNTKTLTIEETGSRTFKSVRLRVHFRDRFTVANEITGIRMGVKLGAAATVDVDRSFTMANTGDHARESWDIDATSYFNTNFGSGSTQTFVASLAVSTTSASNIGGTIWFELILTYEYDETSGTKRMRTVPIVLQSHHTFMTSGSMVEFGTTAGTTNAPANQIPALDTYLEEGGKTYCDAGLVFHANTGAVASDTTPSIQVDAGGSTSLGLIGQALNTACLWYGLYNWPTGTHATNATHSVKAQTDVASTMNGFGGILWVTYSYTISSTSRVMCVWQPAFEEQGGVDGHGNQRTISPSDNTAGDAQLFELVLDIEEPGTITLKQSGVCIAIEGVTGGGTLHRCGTQTYRAGLGGSGIASFSIMRGDHSAGAWTLARGMNRLVFQVYQTLQNRLHLGGYGLIVYSADVPAAGPDAASRVLNFVHAVQGTTPALNTILSAGSQNTPTLYTPWKIGAFIAESVARSNMNGGAGLQTVSAEVNAGEFSQAGWVNGMYISASAQAELGTVDGFHYFTRRFHTASNQATGRMSPTAARRWVITIPSVTSLVALSSWLTVNNVSYTCAGAVTVNGVAAANGKTVKLWAIDSLGIVEYIGSTTTGGGTGAFSFTVNDNTRTYWASYTDGTDLGRSADGTPSSSTFNITIGAAPSVPTQPSSPALGIETTAESIRDRAIAVIKALTPQMLARDTFIPYRNELGADFMAVCEKDPTKAWRWFQVRDVGNDDPPAVSNTDFEERSITLRITVAYSQQHRAGPDNALDRDDAMSLDQHQIEHAIGMCGRANFAQPYPDACWRSGRTERVIGDGVDFLVIEQTMSFRRDMI